MGKGKDMFSYFKRKRTEGDGEQGPSCPPTETQNVQPLELQDEIQNVQQPNPTTVVEERGERVSSRIEPIFRGVEFLIRDPAIRPQIWEYPAHQRDEVRRAYISLGPMQPKLEKDQYIAFGIGAQIRRFQHNWFSLFKSWLEYSETHGHAYCFFCFLFAENVKKRGGYDVFTSSGFYNWKRVRDGKNCAFLRHAGSDFHRKAESSYLSVLNQAAHIENIVHVHSDQEKKKNRLRLIVSIAAAKWLTFQGCAFRGHDESRESRNRGNFLEMIQLLAEFCPDIRNVVLDNAPKVSKYTSPDIQKEILSIYAQLIRKHIRDEIGDSRFSIIVDETCDIAKREQMALVFRFVDVNGDLQERFFDVVHVKNAKALTLKEEVCHVFSQHSLSIENIRGQGYDGGGNMKGEMNGLQALFLREYPYAYYVHCYAHRLQLALVAAAECVIPVCRFFQQLNFIVNTVDTSAKRHEELHDSQVRNIANSLAICEIESGRGSNQVPSLQRAGNTRWGSHLGSITSLMEMFDAVSSVLHNIVVDPSSGSHIRTDGDTSLGYLFSFEFVFIMCLMKELLGITDMLCQALQKKSQDIVNVVRLVRTTMQRLQKMRDEGWETFLEQVRIFCEAHEVDVPNLNDIYILRGGRARHQADHFTNEHFYRVNIFLVTIDTQLQELDTKFSEKVMDLLSLMGTLIPKNDLRSFDPVQICRLVEKYYPEDFSAHDMIGLEDQLNHFILDISADPEFGEIETLIELSQTLYKTRRNVVYHLIDRLIRLLLTLPVSTASAERAFSALKIIKTRLRSKMEDDFLSNSLLIHIESEIADKFSYDDIIKHFKNMKKRRADL